MVEHDMGGCRAWLLIHSPDLITLPLFLTPPPLPLPPTHHPPSLVSLKLVMASLPYPRELSPLCILFLRADSIQHPVYFHLIPSSAIFTSSFASATKTCMGITTITADPFIRPFTQKAVVNPLIHPPMGLPPYCSTPRCSTDTSLPSSARTLLSFRTPCQPASGCHCGYRFC